MAGIAEMAERAGEISGTDEQCVDAIGRGDILDCVEARARKNK